MPSEPKSKCFNCGRSFADLPAHMLKQHGDEAVAEYQAETASAPPAAPEARPGGGAIRTSHNTPNPKAPPPSYAPATTTKEQP